jgi:hypothetical protein
MRPLASFYVPVALHIGISNWWEPSRASLAVPPFLLKVP